MAKRAGSKYLSGARTDYWLTIKTSKRQEVVIAGGDISAMSAQDSATKHSRSFTAN
jgi:ATP-dependent DNA ligase